MKYAVLIYSAEAGETFESLPESDQQAITGEYMALAQLPSTLGGEQLQPGATATTVRVNNGDVLTTDGPYAETKELLGGFYLIDVDDLDAALDFAGKVPAARLGGLVEVRPVVER
ncbi:MAG TPA: YciI family protein [Gaiellaceae bacterium]|nr:YciI family protein [Gaiellaceae bacterium]